MAENNHSFDLSSLKLIIRVDNFYELNSFESLGISTKTTTFQWMKMMAQLEIPFLQNLILLQIKSFTIG